MAKTTFLNGTTILSNWLNLVFGGGSKLTWAASTAYTQGTIVKLSTGDCLRVLTAGESGAIEPTYPGHGEQVVDNTITWEGFGGHMHDSLEIDGSARKIRLGSAAEVTGALPVVNQVEHVHSGGSGQFAKIDLAAAAHVTGALPVANQVEHVHSGGSGQFAKIDPLNHIAGENAGYIDLVFSSSYFDTPETVRLYYRFHLAVVSGGPAIIEISLPGFSALAHATDTHFKASGTPLSSFPPKTNCHIPIIVIDNGIFKAGDIEILNNGAVDLYMIDPSTGNVIDDSWTAGSVYKGFSTSCFSYPVFP